MNSTTSNRTLISSLFLFLLISVSIWAINIIGQSGFPGANFLPLVVRSIVLAGLVTFAYYLNYKFCRKNMLDDKILKLKPMLVKQCMKGSILGFILIATIWAIIYLIYPFEIIRNTDSKANLISDIISYCLGNTLEELLFRGFLLLASIKLVGKFGGIFFVSSLFGLFHLQELGLTREGLTMLITTFTMSLLFIAAIYYTKSIWTAVTLHITGNLLLHTLGFDASNNGMFQIRFSTSKINEQFFTVIYEVVVISLALFVFVKSKKRI